MRYLTKQFGIIFMISISIFVTVQTASASQVIYSFNGTASGSLNGVPFTAQNFEINLYGDPEDIITGIA